MTNDIPIGVGDGLQREEKGITREEKDDITEQVESCIQDMELAARMLAHYDLPALLRQAPPHLQMVLSKAVPLWGLGKYIENDSATT